MSHELVNISNNVLVLGSGGREDALAWCLSQSLANNIFVGPGNGGSDRFTNSQRINLDPKNPQQVIEAAKDLEINLVVVGPEEPLVHGIVDALSEKGILAFGPTKEAAILEGSKAEAVSFMRRHHIPHPKSAIFDNFDRANDFLIHLPLWLSRGIVVKADGLCAGKGVFVCDTIDEARSALKKMMVNQIFGEAGNKVIIQEKLSGFEVSAMAIVDGNHYQLLPFSEDHKQANELDQGPNTGGMGVLAPHPLITPGLARKIEQQIIVPTIQGMKREGKPFKGTLYPGIMIVHGNPLVLEYNVRFGDPELEGVLPLLDPQQDFYQTLEQAASGKLLFDSRYPTKSGSCVVVTLASQGYPGAYKKGIPVEGLETESRVPNVIVFHAGIQRSENGNLETAGGRVLMVAGLGQNSAEARNIAYSAIGNQGIHFEGMHYRTDIGARQR